MTDVRSVQFIAGHHNKCCHRFTRNVTSTDKKPGQFNKGTEYSAKEFICPFTHKQTSSWESLVLFYFFTSTETVCYIWWTLKKDKNQRLVLQQKITRWREHLTNARINWCDQGVERHFMAHYPFPSGPSCSKGGWHYPLGKSWSTG